MRLITRFPDAGLSTPERMVAYQVAVAAVEKLGPFVVETPGNPEIVTLAQRAEDLAHKVAAEYTGKDAALVAHIKDKLDYV
jgi:hypothetical protein